VLWIWLAFLAFILLLLALDLGVFHRKAHVVGVREALAWTAVWMGLGLAFSVFVYFGYENHWLGLGAGVDAVDGRVNDGSLATLPMANPLSARALDTEPARPSRVEAL